MVLIRLPCSVAAQRSDSSGGDYMASSAYSAYRWYGLARSHQRLGQEDEARQWYDKSATWTKEALAPAGDDGTPKPMVTWDQRLTLKLLQSEVSEMLEINAERTTAEPTNTVTEHTEEDPDL